MNDVDAWHFFNFSNLGRKCIIYEERFVLELPTSRAMLATARLLFIHLVRLDIAYLSTKFEISKVIRNIAI